MTRPNGAISGAKTMSILTHKQGDAAAERENTVVVHVCNDIGGWGRGFVLALSARWPEPERAYRRWARGEAAEDDQRSGEFTLGEVQIVQVAPSQFVANVIGQHGVRWRGGRAPIRYAALEAGLSKVANWALRHECSVVMPKIGSGLAGGDWTHIERIVRDRLVAVGVDVTVYSL